MNQILTNKDYYLGWGTLALINSALAQTKNRSGLNWAIVSLFLGPIATFLLVVLPKLEEKSTQKVTVRN